MVEGQRSHGRHVVYHYEFERVGYEQEDRTPSGLWPSDHAGVVARLTLRQE